MREDTTIKARMSQAPNSFMYHVKQYKCYKGYVKKTNLERVLSQKRKRAEEDEAVSKMHYIYGRWLQPLYPFVFEFIDDKFPHYNEMRSMLLPRHVI